MSSQQSERKFCFKQIRTPWKPNDWERPLTFYELQFLYDLAKILSKSIDFLRRKASIKEIQVKNYVPQTNLRGCFKYTNLLLLFTLMFGLYSLYSYIDLMLIFGIMISLFIAIYQCINMLSE